MYNSICAGIVLFNPDIKLLKDNIEAVIKQRIDSLYIYDNASANSKEIKELLESYPCINYELGSRNLGIAYGLNKILKYAIDNGYEWFLTLDQDSICSDNLIESYEDYLKSENVAIITPVILNNGKKTIEYLKSKKLSKYEYINEPVDCITSASLNKTSIISDLGGYMDELFIDCVDSELNCRVLAAGYSILRINTSYLIQKMGKAKGIPVFKYLHRITNCDLFRRMQVASVYSDFRLYYMARNSSIVRKIHKNYGKKLSFMYVFMIFIYFTMTYPLDRSRFKMWNSIVSGWIDARKYTSKCNM